MKSKAERQAEFERREAIRKANYAASKEKLREKRGALNAKADASRRVQPATSHPKYPVPPSVLGTLTGIGALRYTHELTVYSAAWRKQQNRLRRGEEIPDAELLPEPPTWNGDGESW